MLTTRASLAAEIDRIEKSHATQHKLDVQRVEGLLKSSVAAMKAAEQKPGLPTALTMPDRRPLDVAIVELLGAADVSECEKLVDELCHATSAQSGPDRVSECEKLADESGHETSAPSRPQEISDVQQQEQQAKPQGREFRTEELAAGLWDSLTEDEKQPLAMWLANQVADGVPVNIPEGEAHLPDASDFWNANTVFFRSPGADKSAFEPLPLRSRLHAELVNFAAQQGIHGEVALPKTANAARELLAAAMERLTKLTAKADELARSRASDERRAKGLSKLLIHWMMNGKMDFSTPPKDP
jgi:hypothetical protein